MDVMVSAGIDVTMIDTPASQILDEHVKKLAKVLREHWDLADTARRATSKRNAKKTDKYVVPQIDVGDFVLYVEYTENTKLDYK